MPRGGKQGLVGTSSATGGTSPVCSKGDVDKPDDDPHLTPEMMALLSSITASFASAFSSCADRIVDAIDKKLSARMDSQAADVFELNRKVDRLEKMNKDLSTENNALKDLIKSLSVKVETVEQSMDDLEQHSRNSNLLVHGIPLSSDLSEPDLCTRVLGILNNNLGTNLDETDINVIHRLSRPVAQSASAQPPPVVIQFMKKKTGSELISKRKNLKGKKIVITEQLTSKKAQLLKKVNGYVSSGKLQSAWTRDGRVLARTMDDRTAMITPTTNLDQI